jgi:molybdopterin-biosynthesis enzyme MoeA-like protein
MYKEKNQYKVINPVGLVWKNGYKHYCLAGHPYTYDPMLYKKLKIYSKRRRHAGITFYCSCGGIRICLKKLR